MTEIHALVTRLRTRAIQRPFRLRREAADALESLEAEATQLAHEAAREAARADAAEAQIGPYAIPDYLNMP